MIYRFGAYSLDADRHELRRAGQVVAVEPKVFQVLLYLLQHRDRVVTKDDLFAHCWPETFVSEAALTRCLAKVRQAVQAGRPGAPIIKTVHRQGYRFVAAVTTQPAPPAADPVAAGLSQEPSTSIAPLPSASMAPLGLPRPLEAATSAVLPDAVSVAAHRPSGAERRQITVLCCTLVDTPRLTRELDPEDLHGVMQAYHKSCTEVVQRFAGYIAQYRDDGVLVYFGYPQAHEDDAQRAVWTGLGIVAAMEQLHTRLEREKAVQLAIRIGIHTGPVVVGEIGGGSRPEQLAFGETPNIAARLEGLTAPNTVVISAAVYHIVQGYFVCHDLGTYYLKGSSMPLAVYRVLQPSGAYSRLDAAVYRGLSPFVGREAEHGLLEAAWRQARQGDGQFCFVIGHAGMGKSRLIREFTHTLDQVPVFTVQAATAGHALLYHPFRVLCQQLLELPDGLSPAILQDTLTDAFHRHNLPGRHAAALTVLLGGTIEEGNVTHRDTQDEHQPIHEAVCDLLMQKARVHPFVVVLEDLHWFDTASQTLLASLVDILPAMPLLLIGTTRLPFTPMWSDATHITRIVVTELAQEATRQLLHGMLAPSYAATSLVAFIYTRTEGNPLFIEALVQSLQQSSSLEATDEGMILTQEAGSVPPTIHSLLAARLDRLPEASKQLALTAAVVGMESPEALLARLVTPSTELAGHVAALRRQGVLTVHMRSQEVYYRFTHALLQEVAYGSLLRSERQGRHFRIAQALEILHQDHLADYAEILAYHYRCSAHQEYAIAHLLQAADHARTASAVEEALQYLQDARAILDTLDDSSANTQHRLALLLHQERLYDILGRREHQQTLITQLFALLQGSDDQARLAEVYVRQGDLSTQLGRFTEAEQALAAALRLRRTLGDTAGESHVLRSLGFLRWHQGQYAEALAHNEAALVLDRQRHDLLTIATDLTNLGAILRGLGEHERALTCLEEALEVYETTQHHIKKAFTLYSMANIHREVRAVDYAMAQYQQAYDIFVDHHDRLMASRALVGMASILWERGDAQGSLRLYHDVLHIARDIQHGQSLAQTLRTLGELLLAVGEPQQSLSYLQESTMVFAKLADHASAAAVWAKIASIYEQNDEAAQEAVMAWESVRALRMQGGDLRGAVEALKQMVRLARQRLEDPTQATNYLHEAVTLAEELEDQALQGELWNTMGIIAWHQARYTDALEHYEQAFQLYRNIGYTAHAGLMLNSIGVTLRCMQRFDEALARLQEALATNRQAQQRLYEGHSLAALGDVYRDLGNYEQALASYQASLQLRQEIGDRRGEGWMLYAMAQTYIAQGIPARAQHCIAQVAVTADQCEDEALRQACIHMQDELRRAQEA
jgi:class 3 adenylate cyclase/tetratricopeptide (TPR) repeat protein/DNA-binding winged helix-turn-helix (wHTH) protein